MSPNRPTSNPASRTPSSSREIRSRDHVRTWTWLAGVRYDALSAGPVTVFAAADAGLAHRRFERSGTEYDPVAEVRTGVDVRLWESARFSLDVRGRGTRGLDARGRHSWHGAVSPTIGISIGF